MKINDIFSQFNTPPFLFVGSGISRRYLNLPDWKGLLSHFTRIVSDDDYSFSYYENLATSAEYTQGVYPKIASLLEREYNKLWFKAPDIRTISEEKLEDVKNNGLSPFKAEIASYIQSISKLNDEYINEIKRFSEISRHHISGIITTNYDSFLEDHCDGYKTYVGQNELIFSAIQGIAEIYKIHGSIENPATIVINEEDYDEFQNKAAYLTSKLLTIFMEYPIVFLGYSISDANILRILHEIVNCLTPSQLEHLQKRFIFVEYDSESKTAIIEPLTIMVDDKPLHLTKICLSGFMELYDAMQTVRTKLPVKILRRFKDELYSYVITSNPTSTLRVAEITDRRVDDEELVLAIGKASELGVKGLSGLTLNDWYRNVLLDDINYSADDLLTYAFPALSKSNSGRLPMHKYLSEATKDFPEGRGKALDFDDIISNTIKANRKAIASYDNFSDLWEKENENIDKAFRLLAYYPEEQIPLEDLEKILLELFENDANYLDHITNSSTRSNLRTLILIYDYLKWGK